MSGVRQVGIRLKAEGSEDIKRAAKDAEAALNAMNGAAVAGADRATAATKRTVDQLRIEAGAAKAAETALQRQINAATGVRGGGNARASAAARALGAADQAYERQAHALKAALDPLYAAQSRLNTETAEYDALLKRGKIGLDDHANATERAVARYDAVVNALRAQTVAANQAETAMQSHINTMLGVDRGVGSSASASASVLAGADDHYARRAAAIRAAVDPAATAQDRLNAELAEYDSLLRQNLLTVDQHAAATTKSIATYEQSITALRAQAAAADHADTALQKQINTLLGVDRASAPAASGSAQVLAGAEEHYAQRAHALKSALDPLYAAQSRLNTETAEYDALLRRNKITVEQHAAASAIARKRYDDVALAMQRQGRVLSNNERASRLNLSRQASDVFVTAAMGMSPAMIAIQQGPQIMDAWATSGIKLSPVLIGLAAAAAGVAAAVGLMGYAYYDAEKGALAYERAATGIGRIANLSAQQLREAAEAGAEAGNISNKAAREQAIAYVSTGKIGGEILTGLIALSKDYASFMGIDAKDATEALAKAFSEPDKAARDMTRQFGLLDQQTLDLIDSLMKKGDRLSAQKLLFEELNKTVEGHSEKVYGIEAAWNAAARGFSNFLATLGDWATTSPEEHLANLERRAYGADRGRTTNFGFPGASSGQIVDGAAYAKWSVESGVRLLEDMVRENNANEDAANQAAQEEKDREEKKKKPKGKSAEQLAREAEARRRREEDYQAGLEMQIARATNDFDAIQQLEAEARIRTRVRQLTDDGTKSEEARVKATAEEARLLAAMKVQRDEAGLAIQRDTELQVMRLLGEERSIQNLQDRIDLEKAIQGYQREGYDLAVATAMAEEDRNRIIAARTEAMRRATEQAERDHQLTLARLSGNDDLYRYLDIEDRIDRRAREIERRGGLNYGEGVDQAMAEIQAELNAEAVGARKAWIRGLLGDIKQGGIGEALFHQLDRATDRWLDKLTDSLMSLDWGGFLEALLGGFGGGGKGGGFGAAFGALFGGEGAGGWSGFGKGSDYLAPSDGGFLASLLGGAGHAAGTGYSDGGWKWVGEKGPELMRFRRGSEVMDHNRSMMFASQQRGGAGGLSIGQLRVINNGNEPVTANARMTSEGDLELMLEPLVERGINKAGRTGKLAKSLNQTPQTIKR